MGRATSTVISDKSRIQIDAVFILSVFFALRIFVPSRLGVGGLGGAGSPAGLFALACLGLWLFILLQREEFLEIGPQRIRTLTFILSFAVLASYVAAMTRPLDPSEISVADLALLQFASVLGVLMFSTDCVLSGERLITLFRRLVAFVAVTSALGLVQFITKEQYIDRITIPGLSASAPLPALTGRGGFSRASGTALHPIEFGAVLTLVLPVALALAFSDTGRGALRRWTPCALIGLAVVISISRSALLGAVVGLVVFLPALPRRSRATVGVSALFGSVAVFITIPGLSGTILGLFTGAGDDSSVQSRTGSYPLAWEFIHQAPLFGRGIGTFLPSYRILDNQYLLTTIEAGLVGVTALLFLLLAGVRAGLRVSKMPDADLRLRLVGRGAAAGVAAGTAELAFFDGFSFPLFTALLFACVGMVGALERISSQGQRSVGRCCNQAAPPETNDQAAGEEQR